MSGAQRVIKYCAIAFAVFLIFVIGSGILTGVMALGLIFSGSNWLWMESENYTEIVERPMDELEVQARAMEINVKATAVQIMTTNSGEKIRIETNNEYIEAWEANGKLHIVEKSHGFFGWGGTGALRIYVREDVVFDEMKIEVGAGGLNVDRLSAEKLDLELGAGKVMVNELRVLTKAKVNGGAGVIEVKNGEVRDLDMNLGAGKMTARLKLEGNSKVETGVGRLDLELVGGSDDYYITFDKGIGSVTLNGRDMRDGAAWGEGTLTRLNVESGVGAVEIRTTE